MVDRHGSLRDGLQSPGTPAPGPAHTSIVGACASESQFAARRISMSTLHGLTTGSPSACCGRNARSAWDNIEEGCIRRAATDEGFVTGRFGLSGTTWLNEAGSRWAGCPRPMEFEGLRRVPVEPKGKDCK